MGYKAAGRLAGRIWPISDAGPSHTNVRCAHIANIRRAHSVVADAVVGSVRGRGMHGNIIIERRTDT